MNPQDDCESRLAELAKTDPFWREFQEALAQVDRLTPEEREAARRKFADEISRDPTPEELVALLKTLEKHPFKIGG
jgi:hypothetical protein